MHNYLTFHVLRHMKPWNTIADMYLNYTFIRFRIDNLKYDFIIVFSH